MGAYVQSLGFTLLSFALVISVVVFFHEMGHLLVGKAVGVKAVRFSIGFGPKLLSFERGETEYRLSLLPLGGYVKFAGDNPYEEVAPEDRGRGFLEQPPWKRGLIAFAGPAANLVLAVIFYFAVFAAPHQDLLAQVGYVKPRSPPLTGARCAPGPIFKNPSARTPANRCNCKYCAGARRSACASFPRCTRSRTPSRRCGMGASESPRCRARPR